MAEETKGRGGRKPIPIEWVERVKQIAVTEPHLSGRSPASGGSRRTGC